MTSSVERPRVRLPQRHTPRGTPPPRGWAPHLAAPSFGDRQQVDQLFRELDELETQVVHIRHRIAELGNVPQHS